MTKKIIALALAFVMLTTILTACGTKKDEVKEEDAEPAVETVDQSIPAEEASEESAATESEESTEAQVGETEATTAETTTKKSTSSGSSTSTPSTSKSSSSLKETTTKKQSTTTTKPAETTTKKYEYLTYEEVKECVAKAEKYAKSLGFTINKGITIYGQDIDGVHYGVTYHHGADTSIRFTKDAFYEDLKYDIDFSYNSLVTSLGYF